MREQDIRPADLLNEYLRLSAEDAKSYFPDPGDFANRACPACAADQPARAFDKAGFTYVRCGACWTLYANPAPASDPLDRFYRDSPSQRFWAERFFPAVAEARREHIFRPRVAAIAALARRMNIDLQRVVDVGAGTGIFLEEARSQALAPELIAVEPSAALAERCRAAGFETVQGFASTLPAVTHLAGRADLAVCFEVIEHVLSPLDLLRDLASVVRPGGWILVTGLAGSGFDILELGPHAKAVSPPHHLNFISERAVGSMLDRAGLERGEVTTPGQLDVDIVRGLLSEQRDALEDGFAYFMARFASDRQRAALQRFLAEQGLSSHMWILARRP